MRLALFVVLALPSAGLAQRKVENGENVQRQVWFRAAYLGSVIYPGIALGIEYPISTRYYGKGTDSAKITKVKHRSITGNVSWYHHKNYHNNVVISIGYLMRRTNIKGWFTDFEPQLGVSRTFIAGTVYTVDANNNVAQKKSAGDWFFVTRLSLSTGKDLSYNTSGSLPLKIYLRPSLIVLLPYNNFIYVRPTLEIGAIYSFHKMWMVRSDRSYISKGKSNE